MKLSVSASLIVGIHAAVIGLMALQGCGTTGNRISTTPTPVEPPPPAIMPPAVNNVPVAPANPVAFPEIKAPVAPVAVNTPAKSDADNIYVVKPGDSLSKIAKAHGVSTAELKELNNITDANKIRIDQRIVLPDHASPSTSKPSAAPAKTPAATNAKPAPAAKAGEYIVKKGDSLSKIAAAHHVKTKALADANGITDPNKIREGMKLTIPGAAAAPADKPAAEKPAEAPKAPEAAPAAPVVPLDQLQNAAPAPEAPKADEPKAPAVEPPPAVPAVPDIPQDQLIEYTVQMDDTVDSIARLFVVSADDIRSVNGLSGDAQLRSGQVIRIPPSKF